jgi:hypothetical protein
MPTFVTPFRIAIAGVAIAAASLGGCSTYGPENQVAATNGVPCVDPTAPPSTAFNGNVGGAIGGRMILGATPADNKPLCYTR